MGFLSFLVFILIIFYVGDNRDGCLMFRLG